MLAVRLRFNATFVVFIFTVFVGSDLVSAQNDSRPNIVFFFAIQSRPPTPPQLAPRLSN